MNNSAIAAVLTGLIALSFLLSSADALKCYACNDCTDPDYPGKVTIEDDCTYCSTYQTTIVGYEFVSLMCTPICYDGTLIGGGEMSCCRTDLCNKLSNIVPENNSPVQFKSNIGIVSLLSWLALIAFY